MGALLVGYFEKIGAELGPVGRMKLAMLTLISSPKASGEPDSPDNIRKFEEAMAKIKQK